MSRVTHFEIPADDPERAILFYQQVFGWRFEKWSGPLEYWLVMTGPEDQPDIDGGLARGEGPATVVENIIEGKDLDISLKNVEDKGGKIIRPTLIPAMPG